MDRSTGIVSEAAALAAPEVAGRYSGGPSSRLSAALLVPVMACLIVPVGFSIHNVLADTGGAVASTASSASVAPDVISDAVAATAADFRVDESGAATYRIPIHTVPGTAGVGPQMSVDYSSQAGAGVLGKGWSIGGLSSITRCRATREAGDFIHAGVPVDGTPRPITYTQADDRYCLDGQRLLAAHDGALCPVAVAGMAVQTYRTEIESFQRVCAYTPLAGPANGPAFFTVEREDGSISWYGDRNNHTVANRPDAYIETNAPGHTGVAEVWAQTRLQDSTGNYLNYVYEKNPGSAGAAEVILKEVRYTGKNVLPGQTGMALAPYARLIFNYTELPASQWSLGYSAQGARHTQRQRLTSITSCAANETPCATANQARHYRLGYASSNPAHSGLARLINIQECRDDTAASVCAAPTHFEWSTGKYEFATVERPIGPVLANDHIRGFKAGDFNGDGRQDVAFQYLAGQGHGCAGGTWIITTTSHFQGADSPTLGNPVFNCVPANIVNRGEGAWHLFDYDGDGRDDLFVSRGTNLGWQVHPSAGAWFDMSANLIAGLSPAIPSVDSADSQVHLADLNGDGLVDVIYPRGGTLRARLMERQGSGFGWGAERTVQVDEASLGPIAPDCDVFPSPSPVPSICSRQISGIPTPKTGFMQMADFNGDAASDVLLRITSEIKRWTGWPGCPIEIIDNASGLQQSTPQQPGPHYLTRYRDPNPAAIAANDSPPIQPVTPPETTVADPKDPCWETTVEDRLHTLVVTELGAGTVTLSNHAVIAIGNPHTIVLADANGDGLTDVFVRSYASSDWHYQINTGKGFVWGSSLPLSDHRDQARFLDVNGDGRADMLYLVNIGSNKVYHVRYAQPGGGFAAGTPLPGFNARLCEGNGCDSGRRAPLFMDIDGDGHLDFVSFNFQTANLGLYVSRSQQRHTPRDVISRISNGFGAVTALAYAPLTNKDIYRRDANARHAAHWGRGSPVTDLLAPIYAVASASSSSPQSGAPDAMATVHYRYMGAKVQAGGRGFLGFRVVFTIDPNAPSGHVVTRTAYRQDFPFIGMPINTLRQVLPTPYAVPPCLDGSPPSNTCFTTPGDLFPALGGARLSLSTQDWESDTDISAAIAPFVPGVQRPVHVRTASTEESLRDPYAAIDTSQVNTHFSYGPYGNVTQTSVATRDGAGQLVSTVTTANSHGNNPTYWRLKRIIGSTVTHARPGQPDIVRQVAFHYAMGGPVTGLLSEERTQPGGGAALDMRSLYELDAYGNRTRSTQCAGVTDCSPAALVFQPASSTALHRTSRVVYDAIGRY
ncbi:MAG: toxin TcdB middle/N-terminal domain-containing protein, partial [Pseudomonadota bacterium]|nr:toxin TcdB middle/N-terminal domain-containing protein [Pseudomonadota bacterium]